MKSSPVGMGQAGGEYSMDERAFDGALRLTD